jgi:hypothetical protein
MLRIYIKLCFFHKDHLEELIVYNYNNYILYNKTLKFRFFTDFPSLQRLGVDYNTISMQASLPPNLYLIAIQHCSLFKSADMLLYLAKHLVVEAIQFNNINRGTATFF